jgi:WD40 repeat protein
MVTPIWELPTDARTVALSPLTEGSVALVSTDGNAVVVSGQGKPLETFALPRGRAQDHGDVVEHPYPNALHEARPEGWLASFPHERHLLRLSKREPSAFGAGPSDVAAFHALGEEVAIARFDRVELWNTQGRRRWEHEGGPFVRVIIVGKAIVALKADGELLFLAKMSGSLQGRLKLEVPEPAHTWYLAALEGSRFAMTLGDWLVIVDAAKEKVFRRTRLRGQATCLATTDRRAIAGIADGWLQSVDALTGEARGAVHAHQSRVCAVTIAKNVVVSAADSGDLRAWDLGALSGAQAAAAPTTALSVYGQLVASGDRGGRLRVQKGVEEVGNLRLDGTVTFTHVATDDSVLAVTSSLVVRLAKPWKTPKPLLLETPCTAFVADDEYAFSGNRQGTVDVFDLSRGTKLTSYALTESTISSLARPRGAYLVVGTDSLDGRLFVVDLGEAKVVHRIEAHQEAFGVTALAAEARGRVVASGSDDGTIALIEVAKGRVLARLRVPESPMSLAFDSTGKRLAAVFADGSAATFALDKKGAMTAVSVPKAERVAWSEGTLVFGLTSGRIELFPLEG